MWKTKCKDKDKTLVYIIDHALIVTNKEDQDGDKSKIDYLMNCLNQLKLRIFNEGGKSIGIVLSQLNRDLMKNIDRKEKPAFHFPETSDLFGSSAIEQFSDYIIVMHSPYNKLHILEYGPDSLPTWYYDNGQVKYFIYAHLLKNRHDHLEQNIIMYWNDFDRASITEVSDAKQVCDDFHSGIELNRENY
jgi:hypothetical protein